MNRILRSLSVSLIVGGGLVAMGCTTPRPTVEDRYLNAVDPCWPERYSYQARENVVNPFDQMANNSAVLDHTIWNYHFEKGTAELSASGRERIDYLARRRPTIDGKVYLQTARDLGYDPKNPEKIVSERAKLDSERQQAVLAYLGTQPIARTVSFEVQPIDAIDPGINSQGPATSVRGLPLQYRSTLTGAVGGGLTATGGGGQVGGQGGNLSGNQGGGNQGGNFSGNQGGVNSGGTTGGTGAPAPTNR